MSVIWLSIEPSGAGWAIKHNSGILGYAKTEVEAWSLVENLASTAQQSVSARDQNPRRYRHMPRSGRSRPTTVLIVENEALVCLELASRLAEMGLTALVANHADEAMAVLDSHPEIELLLTDIRMPAGSMDGVRLAHHVRDRWPPLKIIVMSGLIDIELSDLPLDSVLLAKPCAPEVLMDALAHMIKGRAAPPSGLASLT